MSTLGGESIGLIFHVIALVKKNALAINVCLIMNECVDSCRRYLGRTKIIRLQSYLFIYFPRRICQLVFPTEVSSNDFSYCDKFKFSTFL